MEEPKSIKEILPERWLPTLAKICKTDRSYISGVVNDEKINSKHWAAVENLALQTDPKKAKAYLKFLKSKKVTA